MKHQTSSKTVAINSINHMDSSWGIIITLTVFGLVGTILLLLELWNELLIILGVMILIVVLLNYLIKFSMSLTTKTITVKKVLMGIPYLTLNQQFDAVRINENRTFLEFQNGLDKITIENHEGFEIDCLLVSKNNADYECGTKEDSNKVFAEILEGLNDLKIELKRIN